MTTRFRSVLAVLTFLTAAVAAEGAVFTVTNTNDSGPGSLRNAVDQANTNMGPDTVAFNIPGPPPFVILSQSTITITDPVSIDGFFQPGARPNFAPVGSDANLLIELAAAPGVSSLTKGFVVMAPGSGSHISGLVIRGPFFAGVEVNGASGVQIFGCYIGTNVSGMSPSQPVIGVNVTNGATGTLVGGTSSVELNLITGSGTGVSVAGPTTTNNFIGNNLIGLNATGTAAFFSSRCVSLSEAGGGNILGHPQAKNKLAGCSVGVRVQGATHDASINANCIGSNAACTAAVSPRIGTGLRCEDGSGGSPTNITIGSVGAGNDIGYCTANGVEVTGGCTATTVIANNIHDNRNGVSFQHPASSPDVVRRLTSNLIHHNAAGDGTGDGVRIEGVSETISSDNQVSNNERYGLFVDEGGGVTLDGDEVSGNGNDGVYVRRQTSLHLVGTIFEGNSGSGVVVETPLVTKVIDEGNISINGNGGLALDLGNDGVTPNDAPDDDGFANYPILRNAFLDNTNATVIEGDVYTIPDETVTLRFFHNDQCDGSGFGEEQEFLCETTTLTDALGHGTFRTTCPFATGVITGTSTIANYGTSEPSACATIAAGPPVCPGSLLSIDDISVTEPVDPGATTIGRFTVTVSPPIPCEIKVDWATSEFTAIAGKDFVQAQNTLTIPPNTASASIDTTILGDAVDEDDETFEMLLSNPVNAGIADARGTATIVDTDTPPTLSIETPQPVNEGTNDTFFISSAKFKVRLSQVSERDVSFNVATEPRSAVTPGDYQTFSARLTIPAGQTEVEVAINIEPDSDDEPEEQFAARISDASNAVIAVAEALATIVDDDPPPPVISINTPEPEVEGTNDTFFISSVKFRITLSEPSPRDVAFDFMTAPLSAVSPGDYQTTSRRVFISAGEVEAVVEVNIEPDDVDEPNEQFVGRITNVADAVIGIGEAVATIVDDDEAPLTVSINDVSQVEGTSTDVAAPRNSLFDFTVSLSRVTDHPVTVTYKVVDGTASGLSDFQDETRSVTIPAGSLSATVTALVVADRIYEADETFFINLINVDGATIADSQGMGTIVNDDALPVVSISDAPPIVESNPETRAAIFTVSLSEASSLPVTVHYTMASGTANVVANNSGDADVVEQSGTLVFQPGETVKEIHIGVISDEVDEQDETFTVVLKEATGATLGDDRGTGTILDDDEPTNISINDLRGEEGTGTGEVRVARFVATLSRASSNTVTVRYRTENGSATSPEDYFSVTGEITFRPGETEVPIEVPIVPDGRPESDETFSVVLSDARNATIGRGTATATIIDDDGTPEISIESVRIPEGSSGQQVAVFKLTLSHDTDQPVTVDFVTEDVSAIGGKDYEHRSGTVTFNAQSAEIRIPIIPDLEDEKDERFRVELSNPRGATLDLRFATGTIIDDDDSPAEFSVEIGAKSNVMKPGERIPITFVTTNRGLKPIIGPFLVRFVLSGKGVRFIDLPTLVGFVCQAYSEQFIECQTDDILIETGNTFTATATVEAGPGAEEGTKVTVGGTSQTELHSVSAYRTFSIVSGQKFSRLKIEQTVNVIDDFPRRLAPQVTTRFRVTNEGDAPTTGPIEIELDLDVPPRTNLFIKDLPEGWRQETRNGKTYYIFKTDRKLAPGESFENPGLTFDGKVLPRGNYRFDASVFDGGSFESRDVDAMPINVRTLSPQPPNTPKPITGRPRP